MKIDKIIDKYLIDKSYRFSENTVDTYRIALNQFSSFLNGKHLDGVNNDDIMQFFAQYLGWSEATKHLKICVINDLIRFASENNYIKKTPIIDIPHIEIPKRLTPRILPRDEYNIKEAAKNNIRDRIIIQLLRHTGIRVSELCRIKISDLQQEERIIFIHKTKGNKQQYAYYNAECKALIDHYLALRTDDNPYLLASLRSHKYIPLTRQAIHKIIKKYVNEANANSQISSHSFRHEFASSGIEKGFELSEMQELLGHQWATSTQRYLDNSPDWLRGEYDNYYHE